jgi:hypothetical protein
MEMSKGTQVITIRLSEYYTDKIDEAVKRRNVTTRREPWTRSCFIKQAILDKLAHMERSKKKKVAKPETWSYEEENQP